MSEEPEQTVPNRPKELSRDDISEGFALLGLETEEKRLQFRIMTAYLPAAVRGSKR